jgi:hypothetical protein
MKTAIEMARECAAKSNPFAFDEDIRAKWYTGRLDNHPTIRAALAMHAAQQVVIDELVDCLAKAFADPERLSNSESAMNEAAALLAKYGKEK